MRDAVTGVSNPEHRLWGGLWGGGLLLVAVGGCFDPGGGEADTDVGTQTGSTTDPSTNGPTSSPSTTDAPSTGTPTSTSPDTQTGTDVTTGETATGIPTTEADTSTGGGLLECVEGLVDPPIGAGLVMIDTAALDDSFTGSCSGLDTPDAAYQWHPPTSDFYVLDTVGSDYDTALYLLDGCDGTELSCNDNGPEGLSSRIVRSFEADDSVVVVLDGVAGESGQVVLNIAPVTCPTADLGGQALPAEFSNQGGANEHGGGCGGDGNPERTFRFTAQEAGLYSFTAESSDFQTAVYLEDGPLCGEPELQCNRSGGIDPSEVIRNLVAGQSVTVVVDSTNDTGTFSLDVQPLGLTCPEIELDQLGSFDGDINDFEHVMTTSCSPAGDVTFGGLLPAATFSWTSPEPGGGLFGCSVSVEAGFPFAVSVQAGSCDGPETACVQGEDSGGVYQAFTSLGDIDGQPRSITVTPTTFSFWSASTFTVGIICAIA